MNRPLESSSREHVETSLQPPATGGRGDAAARFQYDAFISYRRVDASRYATEIRRRLLRYALPGPVRKSLLRQLEHDGQVPSQDPVTVYLDVVYERATEDFFQKTIIPARRSSRYLIVIATPSLLKENDPSAQRPAWVRRELDFFRTLPQGRNIIVAVEQDMLGAALPRWLIGEFPNAERINVSRFRAGFWRMWPPSAREAHDEIVKIAAAIKNVPPEHMPVLRREETRRFRRRVLAVSSLGAVATLAFAVAANRALTAEHDARVRAIVQASHSLAESDPTIASLVLSSLDDADAPNGAALRLAGELAQQPRALQSFTHPGLRFASLSGDGSRVLTEGSGVFRVWRADGRGLIAEIRHDNASGSLSHDGNRLLTYVTGGNGNARVWRTDGSAAFVEVSPPAGGLSGASLSPDSVHVLTESHNGDVRVWRTDATAEPVVLRHGAQAPNGRFSPDSTAVLTWADDSPRFWRVDGSGGEALLPAEQVTFVDFSPDSRHIVGAASDHATMWSIGAERQRVVMPHPGVSLAEFSPDGSRVLTTVLSNSFGEVRLWDPFSAGRPVLIAEQAQVLETAFSPDGQWLAIISGQDQRLSVWRTDSRGQNEAVPYETPVRTVTFSPDSTRVAVIDHEGLRVWRLDDLSAPPRTLGGASDVSFSPDGSRILITSGGQIRIATVDADSELIVRHGDGEVTAEFNGDGTRVLTANRTDGTVRLWSLQGDREPREMLGRRPRVTNVSEKGTRVLTVDVDAQIVWDFASGERFVLKDDGRAIEAALSADGSHALVVLNDGIVRVFSLGTAATFIDLKHGDRVTKARFSPDGTAVLTTAFGDGTARLWSADRAGAPRLLRHRQSMATESPFPEFQPPVPDSSTGFLPREDHPLKAEFSPDGSRVLTTAGGDHVAKIWSVSVESQPVVLEHESISPRATFSPDGKRILTETWNPATLRVWTASGTLEATLRLERDQIAQAEFLPDNERVLILVPGGPSALVWRADTDAKPLPTIDARRSERISSDATGRRLLVVSERTVTVGRSDRTGEAIELRYDNAVAAAGFAPDGDRVTSLTIDGTNVTVHHSDEPTEPIVLRHSESVFDVELLNGGRRALTVTDGGVHVWSTVWSELIAVLRSTTKMCLSSDERVRYLGETPDAAQSAFRACEEGHGR